MSGQRTRGAWIYDGIDTVLRSARENRARILAETRDAPAGALDEDARAALEEFERMERLASSALEEFIARHGKPARVDE
jgi:hypothetical protein